MPLVPSAYKPPRYLPGGDMQTIVPALFRIVSGVHYQRERVDTSDNDFLHVDWLRNDSKKIALLIHGLEANTRTSYMKGMAKTLHRSGYSVAAMNLRGCSGEANTQARAYHSGSTDDVETVINHILEKNHCDELVMVGISLGGNLILKYLGERGDSIPFQISRAVTISVPCDLCAVATHLDQHFSFIYRNRFLKSLKQKLTIRQGRLPFPLTRKQIRKMKSLFDFDNLYTAPMYGFRDAVDYYRRCSGKNFIAGVKIPTLILTALNDPFFTNDCFPAKECEQHPNVFLETPDEGGHVGFCTDLLSGKYYSEKRTLEFLQFS